MLAFVVVSIVVGSAAAGAGGWRALAERYPASGVTSPEEERYRFTSLRTSGGILGTASYGSCVEVGVGARGLSLALWPPFRLFHPPLFIPWDAVERYRIIELYAGSLTQLTIREGGTLTVGGRAGVAIARHAELRGLAAGAG